MLKSATTYTYREDPLGPVQAHFFKPADLKPGEKRPLVIFFHGGFWDTAMATQFVPHCLHFTHQGALAVAVETRVQSIHGTGAIEALEDAKSFLSWLVSYADHLQVDLDKIVLSGAAGGSLLALNIAMEKQPKKAAPLPYQIRALVLFSTLLDSTIDMALRRFPDKKSAKAHSPLKLLRRKLPPMMLFHGRNDRMTPFDDVRKFLRKMKWRKNRVELIDFDGAEHAFFNFNVSEFHYSHTTRAASHFLADVGVLAPIDEDGLD
jgi:acetyl esterase/lipase